MANDTQETYSYDELPYPSHPFEATHPDRLYGIAKLFGLAPAKPDRASILELGCASGGNIIPLAVQMPECRCVGVDLSARQIAEGQKLVDTLKLDNVKLVADDVSNLDESYGQFDYIVCHGVFSWIPDNVQKRILEICRERLNSQGVAYISYNCYPGWFMRGMIRQMMLHHVKNIKEPIKKVQQARALLSFLVESTEGQTTPHAKILKQELDLLGKHADSYLFHEHLEENNRPLFFYEFNEMIQQHGLQFLGESNLASMITDNLPEKASAALKELTSDILHRSQYTDFVTNRMFRQSLLCHKELNVDRHINLEKLKDARYSGSFKIEEPADGEPLSPEVEVLFKCNNGRGLKTSNSSLKALLICLSEAFPSSLSFAELCDAVRAKLSAELTVGQPEELSIDKLVNTNIMQMLVRGDIDYRLLPDRFASKPSETPRVSALARHQASQAGVAITTLKHTMLNADPVTRLLMQELEGEKNLDDLVEAIADFAKSGKVKVKIKGEEPDDLTPVYTTTVKRILAQLKRSAMLLP